MKQFPIHATRLSLLIALFLCFGFCQQSSARDMEIEQLQTEIASLRETLNRHAAKTYIVIDTVHNRLQVWRDNRVMREATCATGSGKVLFRPGDSARWQFHTPLGVRTILRKVTDPIWAKPLWAFVESGEEPPALPWAFRRLDQTTLGAYALELGEGYEIHGTLYPALLGRHITHGCIRLNDDDLAFVHRTLQVGDRVYIY